MSVKRKLSHITGKTPLLYRFDLQHHNLRYVITTTYCLLAYYLTFSEQYFSYIQDDCNLCISLKQRREQGSDENLEWIVRTVVII